MGFSAIGMMLLAGVLAVSRPALAQTPAQPVAAEPVAPVPGTPPDDAAEATAPDATTPETPAPEARPPAPSLPSGARPLGGPSPSEARPAAPEMREPAGRPAGPGIRLVGVVLGEGKPPVALIEIARTRQQALYRVGDEILEARVEQILEDRAILRYQNQPLELRLTGGASASAPARQPPATASPASAGPRGPEANARLLELARRLRDNPHDTAAAEELQRLRAERGQPRRVTARDLEQSVAEPDVAGAQIVEGGVRLVEVSAGGLLSVLGLRAGDLVRSVNRRTVGPERSLAQALAEAAAPGAERLRIEIVRDGSRTVLDQRLGR